MKTLFGLAILGLSLSVPTHAQQRAMSGGAGGPTNNGSVGFGGSPVGGAGAVHFPTLPSVPRAQFQMMDVSGGDASFFPSSFVPFEKGIAEGEAALAVRQKSLGDVALENRGSEKPKAKFAIIQDQIGHAIIERK